MKWNKKIKSMVGWGVVAVVLLGMTSAEIYKYSTADRPLAFVRRYKPDVTVFPKNISADKGEPLFNGDTLRTNEAGYAAVQFMDKSIAKVKPQSELIVNGEVRNDKSSSARITLEVGEIFMEVVERTDNNFEVATSKSVASVKGTEFGVTHDNYAWVEEGIVEFTATISGETVTLRQRMYGQVNDDNSITTGELTDEELAQLREDFEQMTEEAEPKTFKLRFRDENGQIREIEGKYYENNQDNDE